MQVLSCQQLMLFYCYAVSLAPLDFSGPCTGKSRWTVRDWRLMGGSELRHVRYAIRNNDRTYNNRTPFHDVPTSWSSLVTNPGSHMWTTLFTTSDLISKTTWNNATNGKNCRQGIIEGSLRCELVRSVGWVFVSIRISITSVSSSSSVSSNYT